jgi:hypothetical protein
VTSANKWHCLQSIETAGDGQGEGFAHFFATKIFNERRPVGAMGTDTPIFAYYKEVSLPNCAVGNCSSVVPAPPSTNTSLFVNAPPVAFHAADQFKWRNNNCAQNLTRGTELDWLGFYWTLNALGPNRFSMDEIWDLYDELCGGRCNGGAFSWALLEAASKEHFGETTPKHVQLTTRGFAHGVNETAP